jgi:hypothetical protein
MKKHMLLIVGFLALHSTRTAMIARRLATRVVARRSALMRPSVRKSTTGSQKDFSKRAGVQIAHKAVTVKKTFSDIGKATKMYLGKKGMEDPYAALGACTGAVTGLTLSGDGLFKTTAGVAAGAIAGWHMAKNKRDIQAIRRDVSWLRSNVATREGLTKTEAALKQHGLEQAGFLKKSIEQNGIEQTARVRKSLRALMRVGNKRFARESKKIDNNFRTQDSKLQNLLQGQNNQSYKLEELLKGQKSVFEKASTLWSKSSK